MAESRRDGEGRTGEKSAPRIGDWLSEAIALLGRQWGVWITQGAITFAAVAPFFAGAVFYFFYVVFREYNAANTGFETDAALGQQAIYGALNVVFLAFIPITLLATFFAAGMSRTAARQLRGEPIGVGDLFGGGRAYLPALGAMLLSILSTSLCVLFLLVPGMLFVQGAPPPVLAGAALGLLLLAPVGLLLTGRLVLVHPLVAEGGLGLLEAVRRSWRITGRHPWTYLAWALLVYLLPGVGILVLGIGTVVALPLSILMLAVARRSAA